MNILDSSGWLEYFSDGPNAELFLPPLNDTSSLIVPVITIYEVFKVVLRESGEKTAKAEKAHSDNQRSTGPGSLTLGGDENDRNQEPKWGSTQD